MGFDPIYREKAAELAQAMADLQCELLYGGGSVGLMKIIADVMLENHCKVVGTITEQLMDMEVGYKDIDELIVVDSMAEHKKILEDMADGFIAMPGGFGTMDELFEVMVLSQLRVFDKPVALYNVNDYFYHITRFIEQACQEGFIHPEHARNIIVSDDPQVLLDGIEAFKPVQIKKWMNEIKEQINE